jgi:muramidase (phage lysozyme)
MVSSIDQTGLRGKIRDKPIAQELELVLRRAADSAGVDTVFITSGGQPGTSGKRTGSTRHDGGRAADLQLIKDGHPLTFTDENADPIIEAFVTAAAANGAIGIGAGVEYMGPHTLHVGFGRSLQDLTKVVWGAGKTSANAPPWLRAAAGKGWKNAVETPISNAGNVISSTVPAAAVQLLDFIGPLESGTNGYDVIFGNRQRTLPKKLTSMTIDEVHILQEQLLRQRSPSTAVGRYQFLKKTLEDLKNELGLDGSLLFSSSLQDQLGYRLLQQCGYEDFVRRRMSLSSFAQRLAGKWASLPVLQTTQTSKGVKARGQSFYESGLNHARVSADRFEALLNDVLTTAQRMGNQVTGKGIPMPQLTPPGRGPVTLPDAQDAKPWYLSKGMIGGLVAAAAPIISLFFPQASLIVPETATDWIMKAIQVGGPIIGGLLATVGRFQATKPIAGSAAAKAAKEQSMFDGVPLSESSDMMTLPFWQVVAQLPNILSGLQQMHAAAGSFGGNVGDDAMLRGAMLRAGAPLDLLMEAEGDRMDGASTTEEKPTNVET